MSKFESHQTDNASSRRSFLKTSSAVVAGGAIAANFVTPRAAHAAGSDVMRVGIIGCGGRGTSAADNILEAGGESVRIVALADAFLGQVERCHGKLARLHTDHRLDVPEERRFAGLDAYQKVLATDCDMVVLATPPGFRPRQFEAAVDAGKHIFMEKPVAVDAPGVRRVLAAGKLAKEKKLGVGVGLQRHHQAHYVDLVKRLQDGAIGDILLSRVYWNGGGVWVRTRADFAQTFGHDPSELEYQVYNWYYFNWLCGDHINEQHIHNLDVSNWVRGMLPTEAKGMGGREIRTGLDHGQIFDHHFVEYTYPDGTSMMSQCRHQNGTWSAVKEDFLGTKGSASLNAGANSQVQSGDGLFKYEGESVDPYVQEHIDLLASIRSGSPYNEVERGATSTMTAIMGRMATYTGKNITWDQALNSNVELAPSELLNWDATSPVLPDDHGRYPVPVPGQGQVV